MALPSKNEIPVPIKPRAFLKLWLRPRLRVLMLVQFVLKMQVKGRAAYTERRALACAQAEV